MARTIPLKPANESRRRPQRFAALFGACALLSLSGCGLDIPFMGSSDSGNDEKMTESTSHIAKEGGKEVAPVEAVKPIDAPRNTALYNPKNMFGEPLRSEDERLDRLERSVQNMRNEFDSVTPSIKRLMAIEGDIQGLLVELKRLNNDPYATTAATATPTTSATSQPKPAPVKTAAPVTKAPSQAAPPPPVVGGKASVYNVRVGEHPGKTRIVLDVNAKTGFTTDLDNGEKILIVELPNAGWSAAAGKNFGKSSFLNSYKVESSGDGSMAIFQLSRDAKIAYKEDIGGEGGGRRIVIDLAAP